MNSIQSIYNQSEFDLVQMFKWICAFILVQIWYQKNKYIIIFLWVKIKSWLKSYNMIKNEMCLFKSIYVHVCIYEQSKIGYLLLQKSR